MLSDQFPDPHLRIAPRPLHRRNHEQIQWIFFSRDAAREPMRHQCPREQYTVVGDQVVQTGLYAFAASSDIAAFADCSRP